MSCVPVLSCHKFTFYFPRFRKVFRSVKSPLPNNNKLKKSLPRVVAQSRL